jgi:hypothetical protein
MFTMCCALAAKQKGQAFPVLRNEDSSHHTRSCSNKNNNIKSNNGCKSCSSEENNPPPGDDGNDETFHNCNASQGTALPKQASLQG